jgi:predicted DNA-binding transcriptional regulator AlpA
VTRFKTHKCDVSSDLFAAQKSGDAVNTNADPDVGNATFGDFKNTYAQASQSSSFSRQPVQARPITLSPRQTSENLNLDRVPLSARIAPSKNAPPVQVASAEKEQSVRSQKQGRGRDCSRTPSRCMTVLDVAAYLKVSVSTVWRLLNKDPRFPKPRRIGGSTRWDRQDIDHYLDGLKSSRNAVG